MGILNIREAKREGAKVVIGLAGRSGSGKTYTALMIARGMVDNPSEIGFLDTENRRGSLYADKLDGPFMIGDLYPPFSPARYAEAIKEFEKAGVKVLVIDSVTHEWEGEGGCAEIAENTTSKIANWKKAKADHKKFMNVLLQSDMHIIACVRAREQVNFSNPKAPVSLGVQPVCEKNFMFEMTSSVMMEDEGRQQIHLKVPGDLKQAFGTGQGYIGVETGKAIRAWVNSGAEIDPMLKSLENKLTQAASGGVESLKEAWMTVPKSMQASLAAHKEQCKNSAVAYDQMNSEQIVEPEVQSFSPVPKDEPKREAAPAPEPAAIENF